MTTSPCTGAFLANGALAKSIPGFTPRAAQIEMASAVESAIANNENLIVEAGTGCGKSAAYLVPAILSGHKVIVSTGTKNLQDQVFRRDIPAIAKALGKDIRVALLKGQQNYICMDKLEKSLNAKSSSREDTQTLRKIHLYAKNSTSGDKSDLRGISEDSPVWAAATSPAGKCTGNKCGHYSDCFVFAARKRAIDADLVVVNHHLFFADVALRNADAQPILPHFKAVVFDEAHHVPDAARSFYGNTLDSQDIEHLAKDIRDEIGEDIQHHAKLAGLLDKLQAGARALRNTLPQNLGRIPFDAMGRHVDFLELLSDVVPLLDQIKVLLQAHTADLDQCIGSLEKISDSLQCWLAEEDGKNVRWLEPGKHAVRLHTTPISVAAQLKELTSQKEKSWVFCSATLTVRGKFDLFLKESGVEAQTLMLDSPFDYMNQSVLYAPKGLPNPNTPGYTQAMVDKALPLIQSSRGRAFLLFTSLRAMREARDHLAQLLAKHNLPFPILMQGESSKRELLEKFMRAGNAILLGCQSFWEGVDIPGKDLVLVCIDKLPFESPDDPVLQAKSKLCEREGGNPFMELQLPAAALNMKQGAGRLIRTERDYGVLMIADPRLTEKRYGRYIWQSLPPMKRTREESEAVEFYRSHEENQVGGKRYTG